MKKVKFAYNTSSLINIK